MFEAKNRRLYTKEFKQDAVNLSKQPGYSVPRACGAGFALYYIAFTILVACNDPLRINK